jgi:hypothetical protein
VLITAGGECEIENGPHGEDDNAGDEPCGH